MSATDPCQWPSKSPQTSTSFLKSTPFPNLDTFEKHYVSALPRKTLGSNAGTPDVGQSLTAYTAAATPYCPSAPAAYVSLPQLDLPPSLPSNAKLTDRSRDMNAPCPRDKDKIYSTSTRKRATRSFLCEPASQRRHSPASRAPGVQENTSSWEH